MRRSKLHRAASRRPQLAFEPLETRELLAADAGVDWWSDPWVESSHEDWSWSYDDSWASDTGFVQAWEDGWWVEDVSWSFTDGWGSDTEPFSDDVVTSEWPADVIEDAAWDTGEPGEPTIVAPPVFVTTPEAAADEATEPHPAVVTAPPTDMPPLIAEASTATPLADDKVLQTGEEAFTAPPADASAVDATPADADPSSGDFAPTVIDVAAESTGDAVEPELVYASGAVNDADPAVDVEMPDGAEAADPGFDDGDTFDESWVIDVIPPDEPVVDSVVDQLEADLVVEDDPVIITVGISGPAPEAPASTVATPSPAAVPVATVPIGNRFAGWGALLFQSSGQQSGLTDAAAATGAQPGTGRPRIRLPFRPFV